MIEAARVVVVVDWRRQRVHGITCDNAEAQQCHRQIVDRHGGGPLAATQTVGLVYLGTTSNPAVEVAPPTKPVRSDP